MRDDDDDCTIMYVIILLQMQYLNVYLPLNK